MTSSPSPLRVALIGNGFMGAAHSQAWRVAPRFFDLPLRPEMTVLVGRDAARAEDAAEQWGWAESSDDWRSVVARDDIDVVDIVTPGDSHAEIACAALSAGKHVICEKPLANSVDEARAMADAARSAKTDGVLAMVGFTYRRVPAVTLARDLVAQGHIGDVRQVTASYHQDWLVDPQSPFTWRLDKSLAGSGALGDIGAHAIDLAQFVTGYTVTSVSGTIETLVPERPDADGRLSPVTVDDRAVFVGRLDNGVLGNFEVSRMSTGRKNSLRLEVAGTLGALSFDLEDLNSLQFYDATVDPARRGFSKIVVTEPEHPYIEAWWPAGHMLGYEHGFSHQVRDFVHAVSAGEQPRPSFDDGLQVQRVLDAVERSSAAESVWSAV
ncbi:Gfo/Idh/MocA family protein [Agreia sp. Leaf210]|uniref:Gfo/Idh/MocA family protein n=1 Tax=Agreia sp. Leaf210 TaxID=1735682 RepID=UPI000A7DBB91|nr:Gfo/Idh/MocA family oxidoreductase [Agreia sp. Leaf210]